MITTKQRAELRGMANKLEAILFVGKGGITPELTQSIDDALTARELIKIGIQENCVMTAREAADIIHERTHSDVVQVIGRKFVLYRKSSKKPVIFEK